MKRMISVLIAVVLVLGCGVYPASAKETYMDNTCYGDVDFNGTINAVDALTVLKIAVGKYTGKMDTALLNAADVTGEYWDYGVHEHDATDALEILKVAVGKTKLFPVEKLNPYATPIYKADGVLTEGQEVDFVMEFPEDHEVKIMTLCDIHLAIHPSRWIWPFIEDSIAQTNPDLIVLNGDNVHADLDYEFIGLPEYYGKYWQEMCDTMDTFGIPWLFNMGNHDRTGAHDLDWQLETIQKSKYGMVASNDCTGDSNYTVAIKQGGEYTQLIYMVDTNGTTRTSELNPDKDRIELGNGVFPDQFKWLQRTNHRITYDLGEQIPSVMFMHEAPGFVNSIFNTKYGTYEELGHGNRELFFVADQPGDYGWSMDGGLPMGMASDGLYDVVLEIGCKEMVFGHTHVTPASIVDPDTGLRLTWGLKSGWSVTINSAMYMHLDEDTWASGTTLLTVNPKTKECVSRHVLSTLPVPEYDI